jgi:hypothetical protein
MGLDQTYDEMLRHEFGPGDAVHGAAASGVPAPVATPTAVPGPSGEGAVTPLHPESRPQGRHAAPEDVPGPESGEGLRGLARYRSAALVGAGGLACAAVGAFLGGLGGYITIDPAAAHPTAAAGEADQQLANAVDQADGAGSHPAGSEALGNATLAALTGSLTQGISPFRLLTASGSGFLAAFPLADTLSSGPVTEDDAGSGPGSGAAADDTTGCGVPGDPGLDCILSGLTSTLGGLGSLSGDPSGPLTDLVPTLTGVVVDLSGTLAELGALAPVASLPLPGGGLPLSALTGLVPGLGSGGLGAVSGSGGGAIDPILAGAASAAGGLTGSGSSPLSSLPLGSGVGSSPPSPPVTAPSGAVGATSTTTTTTTPSGGGTSTTVTVPLPALPLPSTPPVTVGGASAGVHSGGSGSGLTLTLP